MSGYERPTERGTSPETVTFWAEPWRPMPGNSHGESLVSPKFSNQPECVTWVRGRRDQFETVATWKRTSRAASDFTDQPLHAADEIEPHPERLHALVVDLKAMLDRKKLELDKPTLKRRYSRVGEFNPIERPLTYEEIYDATNDDPRAKYDLPGSKGKLK